eukprot:8354924-Pyramimonas_sp.AAC.1
MAPRDEALAKVIRKFRKAEVQHCASDDGLRLQQLRAGPTRVRDGPLARNRCEHLEEERRADRVADEHALVSLHAQHALRRLDLAVVVEDPARHDGM